MSIELDYIFQSMGSDVRLLVGSPLLPGAPPPAQIAERERAFVLDYARRLSRFESDSELTALNRDPRPKVAASGLLRAAVSAGVWAAERSAGLVDPTLVREIERSGYVESLDGAEPASLVEALAGAPARCPARPNAAAHWREIMVDDETGVISRPPGLMVDTGGTGKGLCADAVAHRLGAYRRFMIDCGGDIAVGGVGAQLEPYEIEVEHPLTRTRIGVLRVARGGVATSGLNVRIWRDRRGAFAHHLLDPGTGAPAWTGLIGATALGPSALEAETLSKMALLLGPARAPEVLSEYGGVIVCDNGEVEAVGLGNWQVEPAAARAIG
ncbi:MAG: FAD:protein FMN transferase [Solirubrobacteraceae bacterium]